MESIFGEKMMKLLFENWREYLNEAQGEIVVALFGPTAAGKSTVRDIFVENGWKKVTSFTTRIPREGTKEEKSKEYKFTDKETFDKMLANQELMNVNTYKGEQYGIDKEQIQSHAPYQVLITDRTSVESLRKEVKELAKNIIFIYVTNPDKELLALRQKERFERGQITKEEYDKRVEELKKEIKAEPDILQSAEYVIREPTKEVTQEKARELAFELKRTA
jgi:guanylate kinase